MMRAASSTLTKAANVLMATQSRLNKLQYRHEQSSESIVPASTVDELTSEISKTISNTETTSSGSAYNTSFCLRTPPKNAIVELPKPSCRLGNVQVEWEGDEIGWRLIELDSVAGGDEDLQLNSNDISTLKRVNSQLRNEQELLKLKIEILLNSISQQTALVSINEETLESLRAKAKLIHQSQKSTAFGDVCSLNQQKHLFPEGKKAKAKGRPQSEPRSGGKLSSTTQTSTANSSNKLSSTETDTFTEAETEISTAAATATPSSTVKLTKTVQFAQ